MSNRRPPVDLDENIPMPRIASNRRQHDYNVPEETDASISWMKWIWPVSGWAYMLINFVILCGATYKMLFSGYDWATHGALVIGFGSSFAIVAAINRYIVREYTNGQHVRRNNQFGDGDPNPNDIR